MADEDENDNPVIDPFEVDEEQVSAVPTREQRERQENKRTREDREKREFWAGVFAHPVGRREMWGLLNEAGTFEEKFACGPNGFPQVEATWFHAGAHAFGQRLYLSWLILARDGVIQMHDELDPRFPKPKRRKK